MTSTLRLPPRDPSVSRRILTFELPATLPDAQGFLQTVMRGPRGLVAWAAVDRQPEHTLVLFGLEHDPASRRVRETLGELDLAYLYRPCAAGGQGARGLASYGSDARYPLLVDEDHAMVLQGDEAIIAYLWERWARRKPPSTSALFRPLDRWMAEASSAQLPKVFTVDEAARQRPPLEHPLQLWNIEASPYCRKVRSTLDRLDLPTEVLNICKASRRRAAMRERFGRVQVPVLIDPNTGTEMAESDAIVAWLEATYG